MKATSREQVIATLAAKKQYYLKTFGVTKIGIFGSFAAQEHSASSDLDIVIEMEKGKKTLHNFLQFKRVLEKEFERSVDLGFEHTLKPVIKEKLEGLIIYV